MIGRSLKARYGVRAALSAARSLALLEEQLAAHAESIVRVRAEDPRIISCLFVRADEGAVRLCEKLGLELKLGGTAVLGLLGPDAARAFSELEPDRRRWLEVACGPRETKVVLVAEGGIGLLTLHAEGGKLTVSAA